MGIDLCPGASNKWTAMMAGFFGKKQTKTVIVKGKSVCPFCNKEHDVELEIVQQVQGAIADFSIGNSSGGLIGMCPFGQK